MMTGRRSLLLGGAGFALSGCLFDRAYYEKNPQQKAFLDGLQALAKPALASNNPLQIEEAAKQSVALWAKIGPFTDWRAVLRTVEGNAQNVTITLEIGPQVTLYAFNDGKLSTLNSFLKGASNLFSTRPRETLPVGLSEPAIAALKTLRLGQTVSISGRMGEIAGSGLFDLSRLFGKSDADLRQFVETPRFVARIETLAASE
jgi:hypothetical protein